MHADDVHTRTHTLGHKLLSGGLFSLGLIPSGPPETRKAARLRFAQHIVSLSRPAAAEAALEAGSCSGQTHRLTHRRTSGSSRKGCRAVSV